MSDSSKALAPPAHILVVDDVEKNTRLVADLLAAKGYRTSKANSGPQALELIEDSAPDLVLLDVMMPGMSGYDVCRTLRADPRHALLPVVLVTALDPATERVKGLDAGADDFISKPINQAELFARVRSLLRVKALQDQLPSEPAVAPARRAEGVALRVCWPVLAEGTSDPQALWSQLLDLQSTIVARAEPHGAILADSDALGSTLWFEDNRAPGQADATARALAVVTALLALRADLAIGVAGGKAVLGSLRRPPNGWQAAAMGPALHDAEGLSRAAGPGRALAAEALTDGWSGAIEAVTLPQIGLGTQPLAAVRILDKVGD